MPETLASTILRKKAARLNKESGGGGKTFIAPSDVDRESAWVSYVSGVRGGMKSARVGVILTWVAENNSLTTVALALWGDGGVAVQCVSGVCLRRVLHVCLSSNTP